MSNLGNIFCNRACFYAAAEYDEHRVFQPFPVARLPLWTWFRILIVSKKQDDNSERMMVKQPDFTSIRHFIEQEGMSMRERRI